MAAARPSGPSCRWRPERTRRPRPPPVAESPSRACAPLTPRSTPRRPGRVRWSSPVVLIAAVAASIAVMALIAAVPSMQPSPPDVGRADSFVRPFDYQVPAGSDIRLYPKSDRLHVLSEALGDVRSASRSGRRGRLEGSMHLWTNRRSGPATAWRRGVAVVHSPVDGSTSRILGRGR